MFGGVSASSRSRSRVSSPFAAFLSCGRRRSRRAGLLLGLSTSARRTSSPLATRTLMHRPSWEGCAACMSVTPYQSRMDSTPRAFNATSKLPSCATGWSQPPGGSNGGASFALIAASTLGSARPYTSGYATSYLHTLYAGWRPSGTGPVDLWTFVLVRLMTRTGTSGAGGRMGRRRNVLGVPPSGGSHVPTKLP